MVAARDIDIYTLIDHILAAEQADEFRRDVEPYRKESSKEKIELQLTSVGLHDAQFTALQVAQGLINNVLASQGTGKEEQQLYLLEQYSHRIDAIDRSYSSNKNAPVHITPIEAGDMAGVTVVRKGGNIGVYFRPTRNFHEMSNNFTAAYEPSTLGGDVHRGFMQSLDCPASDPMLAPSQGVWAQLSEQKPSFFAVTDAVLKREIAAAKLEGHEVQVTVGGISRGGALAQLAAERWLQDENVPLKTVFSVGSPKVGSAAWVREFEKAAQQKGVALLRVESGKDIVPELPPAWVGYEAAGTLIYHPAHYHQGILIVNPSPEFMAYDKAMFDQEIAAGNKNPLLYKIDYHESMTLRKELLKALDDIRKNEENKDKAIIQTAQEQGTDAWGMLQRMQELYIKSNENFLDGSALTPPTAEYSVAQRHTPGDASEQDLGTLRATGAAIPTNSAILGFK